MQIIFKELAIQTILGVYAEERKAPRKLFLNLTLEYDANKASKSDDLADTIDYDQIVKTIEDFTKEKSFNLLEKLSHEIITLLKKTFPKIQKIDLEIQKPGIIPQAKRVSIRESSVS